MNQYLIGLCFGCLVFATADIASAQPMKLVSAKTGTEGDTRITDKTPLQINDLGVLVDPQAGKGHEDFQVTGRSSRNEAFGADFAFILTGMSKVNTEPGTDIGSSVSEGAIDRDSKGLLGIRGGGNAGICASQGFLIGIDAEGLDPSLAIQLTGIKFRYVGGTETGAVVSRDDPEKLATFGHDQSDAEFTAKNDAPFVKLKTLGLIVRGGTSNPELASAFADDFPGGEGAFRIESFELQIVPFDE